MTKLPKLINKTLSFRLSLTVIAALATLLLVALLIIFIFSRKAVKEEALQNAGQTLEATMQRIDNILLKVEQSAGNIYWKMLPHIHQPEKMALYTHKLVEISPYITDCTIAWNADSSAGVRVSVEDPFHRSGRGSWHPPKGEEPDVRDVLQGQRPLRRSRPGSGPELAAYP